jgi:O-antigen/teichoic acid export membrane protein
MMSNAPTEADSIEFSHFSNIRRQLFINSGLLGLSRILSTCTSLVTVPVILSRLGLGGYGSWETMMAIAALVMVFQTTINGTLVWKMSGAYGSRDLDGIRRLMGVGIGVVMSMFALITPFVWIMRYDLVGLSNIPSMYRNTALWVIPILVSQTTVGALGETFSAVLTAYQRAGITTLIQTAALMANSAFVIIGLLHGWQIWSLLLGNTVGVILGIAGQYVAVVMICHISSLRPHMPSWGEAKPLIKFAGFLAIGQISMALRDSTDKFVLASVGNTIWTAWFGLASRLASLTLMVCSFFYVPLISAIAALSARNDWAGVRRLYANTMILMPFLAGTFVVLVASTYDRLLMMWIGQSIPQVGPILFILLAGNIIAIVLTGVGSSLCKGIGKVSIETNYIIICVVANIVLKFVLTPRLGPIGTVVASASSWALGSIFFVILMHRAVELPNTVIRAAAMLPVMLISIMVSRRLTVFVPASTTRWNAAVATAGIGLFSVALFSTLLVVTRIFPWAAFTRTARALRASVLARFGARYAI